MMNYKSLRTFFAVFAFALCFSMSVSAQDDEGRGEPGVIDLGEFTIEGRIQKPNAFYILNRSGLGYEILDLRTSFVREIVRSIHRESFKAHQK